MDKRVLAKLGDERVDKLTRQQLQELADELYREKLDPSTIRNALMPVRALYRRLLQREDVDFDKGLIRVARSYDPRSHGFVEPKSRSGRRTVPLATVLRQYLAQAKLSRVDRTGLIFSEDGERVFDDRKVALLAHACWRKHKLEPVTLHECRHTFASLMIRAGVNVKALATYMGHSSITITLDRYGHLLPGNESEAAALLDNYLGVSEVKANA